MLIADLIAFFDERPNLGLSYHSQSLLLQLPPDQPVEDRRDGEAIVEVQFLFQARQGEHVLAGVVIC
jgi:hypothetical protein